MADIEVKEETNEVPSVPSDVWMRILELLPEVTEDLYFGEPFVKVTLTFLPLVSKQLNNTCKEFKKRRKLEKFSRANVMEYFALNGYLSCMKYVHETGSLQWTEETCKYTAFTGQLDCLIYAHEHGCPWGRETPEVAASGGHISILKYAHEHGCPWDEQTCFFAASNGELTCLKYAHENGCPWNATTCSGAADAGYLNILKYAHENGCPWDYLLWNMHGAKVTRIASSTPYKMDVVKRQSALQTTSSIISSIETWPTILIQSFHLLWPALTLTKKIRSSFSE